MPKHYVIVRGPARVDVQKALFDLNSLWFITESGRNLAVRSTKVEFLRDDGCPAWKLIGRFREGEVPKKADPECLVYYSSKDSQGTLHQLPPNDPMRDPAHLYTLPSATLRQEIAANKELALDAMEKFKVYLDGLNERERLVVETISSRRLVEVSMFSELDNELHRDPGSRRSADDLVLR